MCHIVYEVCLEIRESLFFHKVSVGYHKHNTYKKNAESTPPQSCRGFLQNNLLFIGKINKIVKIESVIIAFQLCPSSDQDTRAIDVHRRISSSAIRRLM